MKVSGIREVEHYVRSFLSLLKEGKITRKEEVVKYFASLGFHCVVEDFSVLPLVDDKYGGEILMMYLIKEGGIYRVFIYKTDKIKVVVKRYIPNRKLYFEVSS